MKRTLDSLLPFAVVAAFALAILLFLPVRGKFEFDTDEGIQLMKAFLYLKGHALQTEIFSDQPPFFTLVLSLLFQLLGPKVIVGRLATLAFACLLLTCAALYLRLFSGRTHYLVALLFLITLPGFPELSVSAMIGLPSLSLAMASLLMLGLWHRSRQTGWLLLSALVLALSVLTKAFSLILVPVFTLAILAHEVGRRSGEKPSLRLLWPAAAWLMVTLGGALVLLLAILGPQGWDQLVRVHLAAQDETFLARRASDALWAAWPMLVLAAIGAGRALSRRSWSDLILAGWYALGLAALFINQPSWYHQHILATLPAAMLAGITVAEAVDAVRVQGRTRAGRNRGLAFGLLVIVFAAGYTGIRIRGHLDAYKPGLPNIVDDIELTVREYEVLAALQDADPQGGLIVTDRPMFAFRSGREVPPELAVFSNKRLTTGWLAEDQVIAAIRAYAPKVVLLARFDLPQVRAHLEQGYELVYAYYPFRLYVRP
jgi:4-amino-4-deoxy-L-arabinose transferase-like glycosyltransferase